MVEIAVIFSFSISTKCELDKRSAKLSQFVIHRGLIISIMQAVFSSIFYFAPIALYQVALCFFGIISSCLGFVDCGLLYGLYHGPSVFFSFG